MLNIHLNLRSLVGRGPGRRRLPAAYAVAQARIAELEAAAEATATEHRAEVKGLEDALQEAARSWNVLYDTWENLRTEHATQESELAHLKALLAASDSTPVVRVRAPIDQGCRINPATAAETVRDRRLLDLAESGEHGLVEDLLARRITWDGGLSMRPPLRDEAAAERAAAVTTVMPAWDRTIPIPVELSKTTGERARESVHAAVAN
ncbi:hypothetical protein [Streptacidiphilus cavernicola]|uniref:Uncharacterized protein n=1 Tax=Streptacidiphilus cavernicola TaxID=3342716 RepID=A0ABV6W4P0_9ACTN